MLNLLREFCRKAESSQELHKRSRVILKITFYLPFYTALVLRYTVCCIDVALYCFILIDAALYRILYWRSAIRILH